MHLSSAAREGWRSRTTFVLALAASAVGLGNLWRFSYLSGEHGGAPFVVTYIVSLFVIAVPVLVAEVVVGSHGRAGPIVALRVAADRSLVSRKWSVVGWLACLSGLLILALYAVVAGWALAYVNFMYQGVFSAAPAVEVGEHFAGFLAQPLQQVYWHGLFMLALSVAVVLGVRRGLGAVVWLAVPTLLALLGYLIKYGFDYGDMDAAREFLFSTRWVDFSSASALVALGHAFYSLGVGVATGICFGAYAPERVPIGRSVMAVAVFDSMIALFAGLAIFPVVFANNVEPTYGPGLLFVSLPYAFGNTAQGDWFGAMFFLLVAVAALGSAVAIMEAIVAALKEYTGLARLTSSVVVGWVVWLLGVAIIVSFSPGVDDDWFGNRNLFEILDFVSAELLLPLVSLLFAVFVGWRLRPEILRHELYRESTGFFLLWRTLLRYIVPFAIGLLLLTPLLI